ncbi:MAG: GntR family transcriptional regulator [Eubacteriales bacterium]|nr:GntR family transcriptional regulator [Eubacteriales bacterium]
MEQESRLYKVLYQSVLTQIYSGVLRRGDIFPSQREICQRYQVGITTVRKVIRMLEQEGVICTSAGKRAIVSFDESEQGYVQSLMQRRESILDIYSGLELMMPSLYAEGAMHSCNLSALVDAAVPAGNEIINSKQTIAFFNKMLLPYCSQTVLDLQTDMEHYARFPYIMQSRLENPFTASADFIKHNLPVIADMAQRKEREALTAKFEEMYKNAGQQAKQYLNELQKIVPTPENTVSYQWFRGKNRSPLYAAVAQNLYRRAQLGEFSNRVYFPSEPEIMRTYNISKSTASKAMALLSDIGLIHTIEKKGSVLRTSEELAPIRIEQNIIEDNLTLFLNVMQILAVCSKNLSFAAFSLLDDRELAATASEWELSPLRQRSSGIIHIITAFLKAHMPSKCLENILEQFDDALIWGHYLDRPFVIIEECVDLAQEGFEQFRLACSSLRKGNRKSAAAAVQRTFRAIFLDARLYTLICFKNPDKVPAEI